MRVIQTFWSGYKDPLINDFGWLTPQHNLMSWALSCLSLKEHYDEVVLYTDSTGYKIFHEYLKLPYDKIIVSYDDIMCKEAHWAYPKLLSYSVQKKPFIHVDGDVYLSKKLPEQIELAGLIAQNKEVGTTYYKNMIDYIRSTEVDIPDILKDELKKESISSYNAGVIGGNDLEFIKEYCDTAFDFIKNNGLNDPENNNENVNHNILFEQILFYALSMGRKKNVSTIIGRDICDNCYTYGEFCNFYSLDETPLMHIIGGHKRNPRTCELLSRTLLKKYPEYFIKIINLFPHIHRRLISDSSVINVIDLRLKNDISISYDNFLRELLIKWNKLPNGYLLELEKKSCDYLDLINHLNESGYPMRIGRNPHLEIYGSTDKWDEETKQFLKDRIGKDTPFTKFDVACIPSLTGDGYKEVLTDDLCYNILQLLYKETDIDTLFEDIKETIRPDGDETPVMADNIIKNRLEYLFYHKLIYVNN